MKRHLFTTALCGLLAACAAPSFDDPVEVMLDREEDPTWRLKAAEQAAASMPNSPQRIKALNKMAWSVTHPSELRIHAIDELIKLDEDKFVADLNRRIVLLDDWDVFEHIAKLGVDRNWPNFTSMMVRHYALRARGIADQDRRERQVLETLNRGKTAEEVVFEVFANFDASVPPAHQVAAWNLVYRLYGREQLVQVLDKAPDNTALVVDLKAAARDLKALPVNREGVLWLSYLRDPGRKSYWEKARSMVAGLSGEQLTGFSLRHIAVLMDVKPAALTYSRQQLLRRVQVNVSAGKHYIKSPEFDGHDKNYPQQFYEAADRLTWIDLLTIDHLWQAVSQPNVVRALFAQAQADRADTSTEYGGVLIRRDDNYLVKPFKPMIRYHDLKFVPSNKMVIAAYTGLAHYHFHAQEVKNSMYAGPGQGDLKVAGRLNFNFLLFTSIDENRLNVDYYQPDGTVVDLGTLTR